MIDYKNSDHEILVIKLLICSIAVNEKTSHFPTEIRYNNYLERIGKLHIQ